MASTVSVRVDDRVRSSVDQFWKEHGLGASAGLRRAIEEWWATQQFPEIMFRDGIAGRRAVLRDGPDVWEVVELARAYENKIDRLIEHFGGHVEQTALEAALRYADAYPDEIAQAIAENERVGRLVEQGFR